MTATVRVEWINDGVVYSAEDVTVTGSGSVSSGAAPAFTGAGGRARIIPLAGAAIVAIGDNPTATQTSGMHLQVGDAPIVYAVATGQHVAITESSDAVATLATSGGGGGGGSGFPADVAGTGTINAATPNAAYTVALANGEGVTAFAVTGLTAAAATLTIEASDDGGTTWSAVNGVASQTGALFSTLTADQQFRVNTGGRTKVRLRVSATGAGTITVASNASTVSSAVALSSPLPAGGNVVGGFTLAAGAAADGALVSLGAQADAAVTNPASSGSLIAFIKGAVSKLALIAAGVLTPYASPDSRQVGVISNGAILFTDDFGGSTVDTTGRWDVLDGGLGLNPTLHSQTLTQAAIGTGTTGITDAVSGSNLTVTMGTTNGAERWYLSQQAFAGAEDLLVILSKSQALTANSIWIGLVEVDPTTKIPLLNPNLAAQFTNMGGVEFGQTATNTAFACNAIGDSSGTLASGVAGTAITALSTVSEFNIEFHAEDVIASNGTVDSPAAKGSTPSRVSTQVPNDGKVYKLLMRFKNVSAPGSSTTVTIGRIMVWDSQEMRVEVASGRGDSNGQKAIAVNVANAGNIPVNIAASGTTVSVSPKPATTSGLSSARIATGFDGVAKASAGMLYSYDLLNTQASIRYFHIYASTTAVAAGGTPVITIPLPANARVANSTDLGWAVATGLAWGITTDVAGSIQGASGDVLGTLGYY